MKRIITLIALIAGAATGVSAQCNTNTSPGNNSATSCQCPPGGGSNCDLLPDLSISWKGLLNYTEYPQTGAGDNYNQGPDDGRLRITGSTPNTGLGSFTVRGSDWYVCGTDTFQASGTPGNCPDGNFPKNLITQRIYHKNGTTMSYWDRWAGSMTYHPSHGHNHVDDWSYYTLRIKDPNEPNPLNWPIVGNGNKQGFCLMDYYSCANGNANGHCRDNNTVYNQGTSLTTQGAFPNFGLGGQSYSCSPVEQGISSGWTDVYSKSLNMMWINIPPGLCNGDYWVVVEVDPRNYFLESDDANNFTAVPITLTQQSAPGTSPSATITSNKPAHICEGDQITLTCTAGTSMLWSTGATTQSIVVTEAGDYSVTVTNYCGTATSATYTVTVGAVGTAPAIANDTICTPGTAVIPGAATYEYYDDANGTTLLGSGTNWVTPFLNDDQTFYVREVTPMPPNTYFSEPHDYQIGEGAYSNSDQYLIFDALTPITLKSVLVYANSAGNRTIYLRSYAGDVLDSAIVNIPTGESRATLNFNVPAGSDYRLGTKANSNLYRNGPNSGGHTGVIYPYTVQNVVQIKNSSAGNPYYYFFYDWEVETTGNSCATALAPVTIVVGDATPPTISGLAATYESDDAPVTMTGNPAGGTFSGQGVTGNMFDPALAGQGGPYTITYTYTLGNCTTTDTNHVTVVSPIGINDIEDLKAPIQIYPNPSNGQFTLTFETKKQHSMRLSVNDMTGRTVWTEDVLSLNGKYTRTFTTNDLSAGVYLLNVIIDGKASVRKLVVN